jgi:hypothetical protein
MNLGDGQLSCAREDGRECARVIGVEVLHEYKCHPELGRDRCEQLGERLKPSRGRADAHDRKAA